MPENFRWTKQETCSICREKLSQSKVIQTFCSHFFHYSCIEKWFKVSPTCPECRQDQRTLE
jgi:hypothetical protein